ncbi:MAG: hypothetical protein M1275_01605, partial [Patescibacteria group bacterium]|nr:hypothetical protein [Patescibacteria group bacterium]
MPELPEVETVVRELNRKLKNKTIKSVEVRLGKIIALGPGTLPPKREPKAHQVKKFIKLLRGQKLRSVSRRAKLLIFDFYRATRASRLTRPPATLSHLGEGVGERQGTQLKELDVLRRTGVKIDGSLAMLVHLKMTGQFIYFKKSELNRQVRIINKTDAPLYRMPAKYTHVIFTFTDGSKLFYNDLRQFGYLKLVSDAELPHVKELQEFGPEPLDKKFTFPVFESILRKRPNG